MKRLAEIAPSQSESLEKDIHSWIKENKSIQRKSLRGLLSSSEESLALAKLSNQGIELIERLGEAPEKAALPESMIKILFLAANPEDTGRLRLGVELREIRESIQLSTHRDKFDLEERFAVRAQDLSRAMLQYRPTIVHFSGHGLELDAPASAPGSRSLDFSALENKQLSGGIALEDDQGKTQVVSAEALAGLFKLFEGKIHCVLLNACHSKLQADAIIQHVPYVVGMNTEVPDKTAITFASSFYDALGAGEDIPFAFELAKANIALEGLPGADIPELIRQEPQ
ncbi:MAG: CHAT domain-containing protein [Bacteroidota bacterium]